MSLPLTTISLTSSLAFGTYRNCLQCLSQLRGGNGHNTKLEVFLSGMMAGIVQVPDAALQTTVGSFASIICFTLFFFNLLSQTSVMSPGDIVKVRLQCQTESKRARVNAPKSKYAGPVHCLLSIIKEDGIVGLYRGALPLMLRDGPSCAVYFLTYATACEYLAGSGKTRPSK